MKKELLALKHARSVKQYPEIDLGEGEYVVLAVRRSKIGLIAIWFFVGICLVAFTVALILLPKIGFTANLNAEAIRYLRLGVIAIYAVIVIAGVIGQTVYGSNRLWITNLRAIQKIRLSLFNASTQVIELAKIEDVSFHQNGIIQHIFGIGALRMSTVGDETTYTFTMLDTPRDELETISQLVSNARGAYRRRLARLAAQDLTADLDTMPAAPVRSSETAGSAKTAGLADASSAKTSAPKSALFKHPRRKN